MFPVFAAATVSAGASCTPDAGCEVDETVGVGRRRRRLPHVDACIGCTIHAQSVAAAPTAGAFVVVFSTQTRISPPGIATAVAPSSPDETSAVVFDVWVRKNVEPRLLRGVRAAVELEVGAGERRRERRHERATTGFVS